MGNKKTTIIASILKPVDDTRMYEKIGLSLRQTNRYEVNIIGFHTKKVPRDINLHFYPIFSFANQSLKRLIAPFKLFKYFFKLSPSLIIATTFEVLLPALLYKLISVRHPVKIIYDVQENYSLNAKTNHPESVLVQLAAKVIQWIEKTAQKYISLNILAEYAYAKELSYWSTSTIIIPNRFKRIEQALFKFDPQMLSYEGNTYPKLIFNGTISESYGIFQAIELAEDLRKYFPQLMLLIIGKVSNAKLLKILLNQLKGKEYIVHRLSLAPVPHEKILRLVQLSDFGMVAHQPTESIKNCFPTRIYEYMAMQKPFLLQDHPLWTNYCAPWDCAICLDFNNYQLSDLVEKIKRNSFYKNGVPDDIFWDKSEELLIHSIDKLFSVNH